MKKIMSNYTKSLLLTMSIIILMTVSACSRDLKISREAGKLPRDLSEPVTEYVDGVVLDRRFSVPGYKGQHFYVLLGYKDLTLEVLEDAELYSDYKIGDKVPLKIYKYIDEDLYEIKYIRDRQRILERENYVK